MNRWEYLSLFKQPSSWAGIAVLLSLFGVNVAPDALVTVGVAVAGSLAVFMPEQGGK